MRIVKLIKNRQESKRQIEEYFSSGSSEKQLTQTIELIDIMGESGELAPSEYRYLKTEVTPMLIILFRATSTSRKRLFSGLRVIRLIGFVVAIIGAASATEAVPPDSKWIPLLFVSVALAAQSVVQANMRQRQPALDWISAREGYDYCLGEVIDRLTMANDYANLDSASCFLLMARRIKSSLDASEKRIIEQIKSFLDVAPSENTTKREKQQDR